MKAKTKIGIVGLGSIAQLVHLPILSKINTVEITAVAEVNKNRLKSVAEKFNIKNTFITYNQMLAETDLDAVIITTPTNTHKKIAIDCLKNGKHLLIEKPIALNYNEAKEIDDEAKKRKKNVMVGMNFRFRPDTMMLKSLINSGELGDIFYLRCGWTRKQSSQQQWFNKKSLAGGGVVLDLGISLLDTALWLFGYPKVKSVSAQNFNHTHNSIEDSSVGFIRFNNSAVLNYEVSWSLHEETDKIKLSAYGTKGTGHLNPLRAYKNIGSQRVDFTVGSTGQTKNLFKKSYENELKHFVGTLRRTTPLISSSEEALSRMKLIEDIYESAKKKKEVGY